MKFSKRLKKKLLTNSFTQALVAFLGAGYFWFWRLTSRCQYENQTVPGEFWDQEKQFIAAFWHSQLLIASVFWNSQNPINILASTHKDGNIIAMIGSYFKWIKTIPVSSKGSLTLRSMFKLLRSGKYIGITPDGPRGPKEKSSDGVIKIAQRTGIPIIPIGIWTSKHIIVNSWDSHHFPLPFSKIYYSWGEPIEVPKDIGPEEIGRYQELLDERISACVRDAKRMLGEEELKGKEDAQAPS